jgi:uncharacterized protein (TIGR02646 family)
MIRVVKPTTPPAVLVARGAAAAQAHCTDHGSAPAEYRSGAKTFDFNKAIYSAPEVKAALRTAQHQKCAFCESFVPHISYGAVEHYRPKAGYKQRKGDRLKRPGYYWLAYDWANLLFCCQLCNEQFKENIFPLKVGRNRARVHTDRLTTEEPLLINPAEVDPANHIDFRNARAVAVGGSPKGKATIRVMGLNRPELREARSRRLQTLGHLALVRDLLKEKSAIASTRALVAQLAEAETALQESHANTAEYAAMARAFLR